MKTPPEPDTPPESPDSVRITEDAAQQIDNLPTSFTANSAEAPFTPPTIEQGTTLDELVTRLQEVVDLEDPQRSDGG